MVPTLGDRCWQIFVLIPYAIIAGTFTLFVFLGLYVLLSGIIARRGLKRSLQKLAYVIANASKPIGVEPRPRRIPMPTASEGVWRLSIFVGWLGIFTWVVFCFFEWVQRKNFNVMDFVIVGIGVVLSFAIPFTLVRGVAWVIRGFSGETD